MTLSRQPCASERNPRRVVLLVEDEPFVRDATSRTLQNAGFDVLPAADAKEAMKIYEQRHGKIDLLMTDMGLPGKTGRQLSQDMRSASAEIPILLTSGYVEREFECQPGERKTYFLPKPYTRTELIGLIDEIFRHAVQRRAATQAS